MRLLGERGVREITYVLVLQVKGLYFCEYLLRAYILTFVMRKLAKLYFKLNLFRIQ